MKLLVAVQDDRGVVTSYVIDRSILNNYKGSIYERVLRYFPHEEVLSITDLDQLDKNLTFNE